MLSHHQFALSLTLDQVIDRGHAHVEESALKRWYDKERLSKAMFRDIQKRYAELDDGSPLFIGDLAGSYLFIYGKGLTAEDGAWLKPMDDWLETW